MAAVCATSHRQYAFTSSILPAVIIGSTCEPSTPTLPGKPMSFAYTSRRAFFVAPKSARKSMRSKCPSVE
ncbi:MAG: hypothetical protein ABSE49_30030 [Polyangiaceae bacterium]